MRDENVRGAPTEAAPLVEHGVLGWVIYQGDALPTHPIPTWDIRGHMLSPSHCPCRPQLDDESEMFVHNAFDGRERYEYGHALKH